MIRTILVPISGIGVEDGIFETAFAIAEPLRSHIDFYHLGLSAVAVARRNPHDGFCLGRATAEMLKSLNLREDSLSAEVSRRFHQFCESHNISERSAPVATEAVRVSARLINGRRWSHSDLLLRSRHSDLSVLRRPRGDGFAETELTELLLLGSGHPVLVAPESSTGRPLNTVIVGWQERAAGARALNAALPILRLARRVHLVSMAESLHAAAVSMDQVKTHITWHGIKAEGRGIVCPRRHVADELLQHVRDIDADLLVTGAFDYRPIVDEFLGGVTHSLLQRCSCPLFLTH